MIRMFAILLGVVSIAWCDNSLTRQERKEGFELLFDGKTLARWHSIRRGPDASPWRVRKGILTYGAGESWLATDDTYFDFTLRLEYRTGPGSDSGILLRSGPEGNPGISGLELQILSDSGKPANTHSSLSIWGAVAPTRNMAKPDGQWNQVEVTVIKRQLSAVWNGEKVLDVNLDDPQYANAERRPLAERLPYGYIGLQAHTSGPPVEFRNIRLKVLKMGPLFVPEK